MPFTAVRLDPFQTIVNVHWSTAPDLRYLVLLAGVANASEASTSGAQPDPATTLGMIEGTSFFSGSLYTGDVTTPSEVTTIGDISNVVTDFDINSIDKRKALIDQSADFSLLAVQAWRISDEGGGHIAAVQIAFFYFIGKYILTLSGASLLSPLNVSIPAMGTNKTFLPPYNTRATLLAQGVQDWANAIDGLDGGPTPL